MKVDICVVTKNDKIPNFADIPVNEIIIENSVPLAKARQRAIEKVTTDWFVFIDDDIILPDDWWKTLYYDFYIGTAIAPTDKVGAIQGTAIPIGLGENFDKAFFKIFMDGYNWRELNGNSRMFTHNTLIRTEAVKDWNPPADLEAYEDLHMMKHIQKQGYKVFVVKTETYHQYSWNRIWTTARWGTRGRLRFFPRRDILKDFAGTPITFLKDGWCIGLPNFIRAFAALYEMTVGGRK